MCVVVVVVSSSTSVTVSSTSVGHNHSPRPVDVEMDSHRWVCIQYTILPIEYGTPADVYVTDTTVGSDSAPCQPGVWPDWGVRRRAVVITD